MPIVNIVIRHIEFFIHICKLILIKIYNDNKLNIFAFILIIIFLIILIW